MGPLRRPCGPRVGVVGTGASAIQLVPELARTAAHVTLFQRSPAWIVPRGGTAYTEADRARFAAAPRNSPRSGPTSTPRASCASPRDPGMPLPRTRAQAEALAHLEAQVADPALRAALTPDYAFGCKRVLLSDEFYPAVASDAVTLVPASLERVDGSTLVAADGARHEVDALVLATGFASTQQPYAELVVGERRRHARRPLVRRHDLVRLDGRRGLPNLFVLNGPNASLGHSSSVLMIEEQAATSRACSTPAPAACCASTRAPKPPTPTRSRRPRLHPLDDGRMPQLVRRRALGPTHPAVAGHRRRLPARLARADGSEFLPAPAPLPR